MNDQIYTQKLNHLMPSAVELTKLNLYNLILGMSTELGRIKNEVECILPRQPMYVYYILLEDYSIRIYRQKFGATEPFRVLVCALFFGSFESESTSNIPPL